MNPGQRYVQLYEELWQLCKSQTWGDPFSYARSREIHLAVTLGHTIAQKFAGPDGHETDGTAVEYKTTTTNKICGTYNGISVHDTWEKQLDYLKTKKIGCYKWHYIARYNDDKIVEIWRLSGDKVMEILEPKLNKQWHSEKKRKDPRLGAQLTSRDITTFGEKINIP
jgi:hypothetical protein